MIRHLVCIDAQEGTMRRYEQLGGKVAVTSAAPLPQTEDAVLRVERFRLFPADYIRDLMAGFFTTDFSLPITGPVEWWNPPIDAGV